MKTVMIRNGEIVLEQTAEPLILDEHTRRVIVKVRYSAISPGTEWKLAKQMGGDRETVGYCASGEVVEVGSEVIKLKKGDFVACYGSPYVHHAEILSVPERLCVRLTSESLLLAAAFTGLGAIAVHSVRKLEMQFGETVQVLGLGILGQLAAKICSLANYRVWATDMDEQRIQAAERMGIRTVVLRNDIDDWRQSAEAFTYGHGFDRVAVCATTEQSGVLDECIKQLAPGGRIVMVGNTPMQFERTSFFLKEAELAIARAGGPGRYERDYEEGVFDYPQEYLRWTEQRNMAEFIRYLEEGLLNLAPLITHQYHFNDAIEAYRTLFDKQNSSLGVVFEYSP